MIPVAKAGRLPDSRASMERAHETILKLRGAIPFGVGGRRSCFVHPLDPAKCVKVLRDDPGRAIRHRKSRFLPAKWRRAYDNNAHEKKLLEAYERRLGPVAAGHIPLSYGMAETDLGPGLVLDLARDHDGQISRTIRELITCGYDLERLRQPFAAFGKFLRENRIYTRNLLDHNLVVVMAETGPGKIMLIDGFGDPSWIPFAKWFPAVGREKINRRLRTAWERFEALAAQGGVSEEERRGSTWDQGFLRHRG